MEVEAFFLTENILFLTGYRLLWLLRIRNCYAFGLLDPCCENDIDITLICVAYGFPKCREGEVPPFLFYHPQIQNVAMQSNGILK